MFKNYFKIIVRNLWRNKLYTLINIIGLGVGIAFLLEMLDRRIRSRDDLLEAVPFPVLGVIERAKRRSKLAFWHRTPTLALK